MSYFNQKEEVIEIELTQYGKYLLSRGKLKPAYYAFFDDDIIYDGKYANIQETNAISVERIKNTPRTKTQYVFTGIEKEVTKNLTLIKENKEKFDSLAILPQSDKHYALSQRLGTSFLGSKNLASMNITALNGEILKTTILQTGSMPNLKIPIIELKDVNYTISKTPPLTNETDSITAPVNFEDGTSLYVKDDYLLLELYEENVEDEMKNFEIEMFIVEKDKITNQEFFVPLHFDQKTENYKNGILLDKKELGEEDPRIIEYRSQDQFRAENYFNIFIDEQIDKNIICKLINRMKQNFSQYDNKFDCEEYQVGVDTRAKTDRDISRLYDASFVEEDIKKC